jgi:hypothetical protein
VLPSIKIKSPSLPCLACWATRLIASFTSINLSRSIPPTSQEHVPIFWGISHLLLANFLPLGLQYDVILENQTDLVRRLIMDVAQQAQMALLTFDGALPLRLAANTASCAKRIDTQCHLLLRLPLRFLIRCSPSFTRNATSTAMQHVLHSSTTLHCAVKVDEIYTQSIHACDKLACSHIRTSKNLNQRGCKRGLKTSLGVSELPQI